MKRENFVIGSWLLGAIVFVMVMFLGTTANATRMYNFKDWGDFSFVQSLCMNDGDNLLVRVDGVDKSLFDAGYLTGSWHLGLIDDRNYVVGWAKNSIKSWSGYEGWLTGDYSWSALYGLSDGEKPVHAYLVYDSTDNGWDLVGGQVGSEQDLLDGDLFFTEEDILFNGVRGGVAQLPPYTKFEMPYPDDMNAYLPNMTVVIPEPATITILAIGGLLLRRRFK